MSAARLTITAASFVHRHADQLTAIASVLLAAALAIVVDRLFARRARALASAVGRGELTPVARTRLRFVRRLVYVGILALGVLVALTQFPSLHRLANSLLASGALAAAVVGFAARQVLANAVAGVMLAITQPLRIGDRISFEGETGTVEDIRLNYTYLLTHGNGRIVIPNERLAGGIMRNETVLSPLEPVEVSIWLRAGADTDEALALLAAEGQARVAETTTDGVRLTVAAGEATSDERAARESELLAGCLRRLRGARALS